MKRLFYGVVMAMALVACASSKPQPSTVKLEREPTPGLITLKEGDRTPAGEPTVGWVKDTQQFSISPEGGTVSLTFIPRKVMTWDETVPYTLYESRLVPYSYNGTCERYICTSGADKQSPFWDRFFRVKNRTDKIAALGEAIKGIGEKSAEALVERKYFSRKPASWAEFEREIERAEKNGVITGSVAQAVLQKYKADNLSALGYEPSSCTLEPYSCVRYGERLEQVPVVRYRQIQKEKILEQRPRAFLIRAINPILDSFEKDELSITVGVDDNDIVIRSGESKTVYRSRIDLAGGLIELTGVDRLRSQLPAAIVRGDLDYNKKTLNAELKLSFDPRYVVIPKNDGDDQLVIQYVVGRCRQGFFGWCKSEEQEEAPRFHVAKSPQVMIPIPMEKNERVWVRYSVARLNSKYYFEDYTFPVQTSAVNRNR